MRQQSMGRRFAVFCIPCLAFALAGCQPPLVPFSHPAHVPATTRPTPAPVAGHPAPDFSLPRLDSGGTVSLRQLLTGKPLVINAWASWCDHCAEETGAFVRLAEAYHGRLQVVFINMTASDSWTDARAFARRHGMTGLVLADPHGTFMDRYGILVLPTTFLISPEGTVCAVKQGAMTYPEMARFVAPALSTTRNKPVAPGKADRPTGPSR